MLNLRILVNRIIQSEKHVHIVNEIELLTETVALIIYTQRQNMETKQQCLCIMEASINKLLKIKRIYLYFSLI